MLEPARSNARGAFGGFSIFGFLKYFLVLSLSAGAVLGMHKEGELPACSNELLTDLKLLSTTPMGFVINELQLAQSKGLLVKGYQASAFDYSVVLNFQHNQIRWLFRSDAPDVLHDPFLRVFASSHNFIFMRVLWGVEDNQIFEIDSKPRPNARTQPAAHRQTRTPFEDESVQMGAWSPDGSMFPITNVRNEPRIYPHYDHQSLTLPVAPGPALYSLTNDRWSLLPTDSPAAAEFDAATAQNGEANFHWANWVFAHGHQPWVAALEQGQSQTGDGHYAHVAVWNHQEAFRVPNRVNKNALVGDRFLGEMRPTAMAFDSRHSRLLTCTGLNQIRLNSLVLPGMTMEPSVVIPLPVEIRKQAQMIKLKEVGNGELFGLVAGEYLNQPNQGWAPRSPQFRYLVRILSTPESNGALKTNIKVHRLPFDTADFEVDKDRKRIYVGRQAGTLEVYELPTP